NLIVGSGVAAISFQGDTGAAPAAVVPFGRIANNTLVGSTGNGVLGTGIAVANNAGPTIVNNIVAGFNVGISIDASSLGLASPPVLGENIYKGNTTNDSIGTLPESNPIPRPGDPPVTVLFTNASVGN